MQLTLYYQPGTRAQRVRWMLEELELDYDLENIDLFGGEGNSEAYLRILLPAGHTGPRPASGTANRRLPAF